AVEGGFKDVPGVKHFSISLLSERAVIEHDPTLLSAEQIAEIIEDRGFDAEIVDTGKTDKATKAPERTTNIAVTTVAIEGMTCGACTSAVEGGFEGLAGVLKYNTSLLAERAVITHDVTKLSPEQILETIDDRGFDAAAQALEPSLLALPGIDSASVSLATSRLTVTHQPDVIGLRWIVEAVEAHVLNALVADNRDNNAQL
ncbi:hypothetical protein PC129_g24891, partial [Phytophthora cactorum]